MKRYLVVAAVLALCLVFSVSGVSLAQEEEKTAYSWGTISSISSNQIVVTEYDYDNDEEVDITYTVDPNTEFKDTDSLESINVGDAVDIEYTVEGEKNVIKIIALEKPFHKEESTPSETYEEPSEYFPEEIE